MTQQFRFSLTLAVWAILVGAGALLGVFFVGFRDSIDQERDAYLRLARQDSLLLVAYSTSWDAYRLVRRTYASPDSLPRARQAFAAIIRRLDSVRRDVAASFSRGDRSNQLHRLFQESIDSVQTELTAFLDPARSKKERVILGRRLFGGDISSSMARLRELNEPFHQAIMSENIGRIASVDKHFEEKYSSWAIALFGFVVAGVLLTVVLKRMERRQSLRNRQLLAGEEQFRSIVENAQDGIVVLQGPRPVFANSAAIALFGFTDLEKMQAADLPRLLGPAACAALLDRAEGRSPEEEIVRHEEFRCMTKQGRMMDLEGNARMVSWNDAAAVQVAFRDITDRKMREREQALLLWEQEALSQIDRRLVGVIDLNRILDAILTQVVNLTKAPWAGVLMREGQSNRLRWRSMQGAFQPMSAEPFVMRPPLRAVMTGTEPFVMQEMGVARSDRLTSLAHLSDEGLVSSVWIPMKGEQEARGVLVVGYRNAHEFSGRELRLLLSMAEKTSIAATNASLYEDLLAREHELEVLSGARVNAQEEERRRIAREIHDGLGQILTAVKFNIEILEDSPSLNPEDRRRITDVKTLLDNVMKEAREISYNLMPSVLDDFGLAPALQLLAERFGTQTGVQVTCVAQGMTQRLPGPLEIALYRIVQEALTNAVRHGEASLVAIQAFRSDRAVRLTIEDNGKGMEQEDASARRLVGSGIGLASMRERVSSFRGEFLLESAPGNGTLITVEIPVPEQERAHV